MRRDKLLAKHKGLCGICLAPVDPKKFEIDHVVPTSKGGTHCYANCQPSHPQCNRVKADYMPEELWRIAHLIGGPPKPKYKNHGLARRKRKRIRRASTKPAAS